MDFIRSDLNTIPSEVQLDDQDSVFGTRTDLILKITLLSEYLVIVDLGAEMGFVLDMNPYSFHAKFLKWTVSFSAYLHWSAFFFYCSCYYIPTVTLPLQSFLSFSRYFQFLNIFAYIPQDMLHVTFFSQLHLILNNFFRYFYLLNFYGFSSLYYPHTTINYPQILISNFSFFYHFNNYLLCRALFSPPKHGAHLFHLSAPLIPLKFQIWFQPEYSTLQFLAQPQIQFSFLHFQRRYIS